MKSQQRIIEKRIDEKQRPAEHIKEYGKKGLFIKSERYSKEALEDIQFNCRFFNEEKIAYNGNSTALSETTLTLNTTDSGTDGVLSDNTYTSDAKNWDVDQWAGFYLKTNGNYFYIISNTAKVLTFREEVDISPDDGDYDIVPFIASSMYNSDLNPNTGQADDPLTVFKIISNTDTVITVEPNGSTFLDDIGSATDPFEVKGYYAPRLEDFTEQNFGIVQSKILDAPLGRLNDKNMGEYFIGVYSVRFLTFRSKTVRLRLDVPDSLRIVQIENNRGTVLLDSKFGQNRTKFISLYFTANVWKRLDIFYYTETGDYGFTIEGADKPLGNYIDAWSDVTPEAPQWATGYPEGQLRQIELRWINTGLLGQGGGTQIFRSDDDGETYHFIGFVPWDHNMYIDLGSKKFDWVKELSDNLSISDNLKVSVT